MLAFAIMRKSSYWELVAAWTKTSFGRWWAGGLLSLFSSVLKGLWESRMGLAVPRFLVESHVIM